MMRKKKFMHIINLKKNYFFFWKEFVYAFEKSTGKLFLSFIQLFTHFERKFGA